jgi:hypothetical protein
MMNKIDMFSTYMVYIHMRMKHQSITHSQHIYLHGLASSIKKGHIELCQMSLIGLM